MKTALQELIEWMEEQYYPAMYEDAIDKATELLEKEREQIVNSYHYGQMGIIEVTMRELKLSEDPDLDDKQDAEQYFNETFKQ